MGTNPKGSVRLFRFVGTDVFVHWGWLVVAWIELSKPVFKYQSQIWNAIEYLALFAIVTMHEFGHVLACRQVGGKANQIMLWPLGGVALVQPPPRPGAQLWTIAVGPLVNFLLIPVTFGGWFVAEAAGLRNVSADAAQFVGNVAQINVWLLIFNLLPVYPLDGGRILQSLLWLVVGRVWSLRIAGALALVASVGLVGLALATMHWWWALLGFFVASQSLAALRLASAVSRTAKAPRRSEYACPSCRLPPPVGSFWICRKCQTLFDTFEHLALCPGCGQDLPATQCPRCETQHSLPDWIAPSRVVEAQVVAEPFDHSNPYASHGDLT